MAGRRAGLQVLVDGIVVQREKTIDERGCVFLFPETLSINGNIETSTLYRGIYEAVVYQTGASISGTFDSGDEKLAELDEQRARLLRSASARGIDFSEALRSIDKRIGYWEATYAKNEEPE